MEQEVCRNLANYLRSAIGLLDAEREAPLRKDVISVCDLLENPSFRIAVFGPFNYGKSTLLNAILGNRTLPIDLIPTTGAAINVKYGDELHTRITLVDGTEITESGTEVLKRFAILDDDRRMRSDVASIEVTYPHPFLQTGVELLDLPGTNDREAQDNLVRDQLLTADLVIQVLDARKLMTLSERENLRDWLSDHGIKTVVFVVNFLNLLEPEDQKQVYNRLLFVAESFRSELPPNISNLYRVDALPALRARLKGDISAAHSTGLVMFESALQSIVAQQENKATRLLRMVAIANLVKQAITLKIDAIASELAAAKQKHNAKIKIQQKAEKLIKQGFQASISDFQGWLYLPKLLERYQSEVALTLQQGQFKTWETEKFKPAISEHQQAIVKWVHQACEFFDRTQPADLYLSFPHKPEVLLPKPPSNLKQSNNSKTGTVGMVTELSQFLVEAIGGVVVGGANYLFGDDSEEKPAASTSSPTYLEQVKEAYDEAASDYLIRFNTQAMFALRQYEEQAEKVINFQVTEASIETTSEHHQLQLLNTLLDNLNRELESIGKDVP